MKTKTREVKHRFNGVAASDGAGVQLTRIIGSPYINMFDPFLLLDAFGSDKPQDYIAGFPAHPHRGFETVTYMHAGKMRHEDSAGNAGVIESGGVQWMTAGRGIVHSEMPEQEEGLLSGFQLWVNLPASKKMTSPKYQEKTNEEIPVEKRADNIRIKVIAGTTSHETTGVIENNLIQPIYWDIHQPKDTQFKEPVETSLNAFIYVYEGEVVIGSNSKSISAGQLAILEAGDDLLVSANTDAKYLLIAGKPLNEPVARSGPFVMNTREEINQAFLDYQTGNFI